jgi:uncharacterized protein (TIGR03067 family)
MVLVTSLADPLPAEAWAELKQLSGKWRATHYATGGAEMAVDEDDELPPFEFRGRFWTLGRHYRASVAALDPTTDPKCLDFRSLERGGRMGQIEEAVFKLDGDTLTIVLHMGNGRKRPTDLGVPRDDDVVRVILKRVKE